VTRWGIAETLGGRDDDTEEIPMRLFFSGVALLFATTSFVSAQPKGSCELKVLDGKTRELRTYVPGPMPVEFPIDGVPGWSKCRMSELKHVTVQGNKGLRVDLWCMGVDGQAMGAAASAVNHPVFQSYYDLTIVQLLSMPVAFTADAVDTSAFKEITIACDARGATD
jgi:hypothetical protein